MRAIYVDSSAVVKLVVEEPESLALRHYLRRRAPLVSSALARTEVLRAVLRQGAHAVGRGRLVLSRLDLLRVNDRILDAAATLQPENIRSLDAVHLASAQQLGSDLSRIVSYDERMLDAAWSLGLETVTPV